MRVEKTWEDTHAEGNTHSVPERQRDVRLKTGGLTSADDHLRPSATIAKKMT